MHGVPIEVRWVFWCGAGAVSIGCQHVCGESCAPNYAFQLRLPFGLVPEIGVKDVVVQNWD